MDYTSKALKANELIRKYGGEITVTRPGGTSDWARQFDPAQSRYRWYYIGSTIPAPASPVDTKPTGSDTTILGVGVMVSWSTAAFQAGIVSMGDVKLITQTPTAIKLGDKIALNGNTYTASNPITRVSPDGIVVIIQEVNCRV